MKLYDYYTMYRGWCEFDIPDTEIDITIYLCYDNEKTELDKDFPYMDKFTELLMKKVDIDYFVQDGIPVCNFSKIIHSNIDLFKEHIKKNWIDEMQWVLEDNSGEFEYEIIKEFGQVVGGNYGESVNKQYYKLLSKCKE